MGSVEIPTKVLTNTSSQLKMPVVGMGSAPDFTCKKDTKDAIIEAIKQGYRHFDTAAAYGSEQALGEALKEAIELGLVTRQDLFVTSKLWVTENHPHLVIPALQKSLKTLQLDYLDLYLIHWPLSSQPGKFTFPIDVADLLPFDVKGVWESMEEGLKLGLTKAIGVSNFSVKKLENLLSVATILPAVNQVEMNLAWQQKKLREFCNANGIVLTAFSPLRKGASRGPNEVMENDMLKEIADAHGKVCCTNFFKMVI
uniref:NADP-dependent oxidoreductase domain-containing protein n=1 Tax=Medicago truncatula TaxID=3880 RepID=B7FKC8_MEDTR|nr:unknown [Medicago truncatula]